MLSNLQLDMQWLHKYTFRMNVGALPAENIWPDHLSCPDRSGGITKYQSSARILSRSSPSLWKTAHVLQQLLHSFPRFINNSSLFSEWCGICMESMQKLIKHRLEWELGLNGLEIIIVDLPAPCMQGRASLPAYRVVQNCSSLLHLLPVSSFTDVIFLLHKVQTCWKATLHQLTSSLAHCPCFLNQPSTFSKAT